MGNVSDLRAFLRTNPEAVRVEVLKADGSTPREAGAWMLVSPRDTFQTIGGGQLEHMAIERARGLLQGAQASDAISLPLGPAIGQCCGGRVEIGLTRLDARLAERCVREEDQAFASRPHVYLFGAGHVGVALARTLALLPVRTIVADTRPAELERVPAGIETCLTPMPETLVRDAPAGCAFVILTHDHSLDFVIAAEVLARDDIAYAGMIGSKTKRATFRRWYMENGGDAARFSRLVCPIGASRSGDKRPAVIATFAAAEIMDALVCHAKAVSALDPETERIA